MSLNQREPDVSFSGIPNQTAKADPGPAADEIQIVLRDLRIALSGLVRDRTVLRNPLAATPARGPPIWKSRMFEELETGPHF